MKAQMKDSKGHVIRKGNSIKIIGEPTIYKV